MAEEKSIQQLEAELSKLRKENALLKQLLNKHGLLPEPHLQQEAVQERIQAFKRLFRGRQDVYAQRVEDENGSKYYPVKHGKRHAPLTDSVLYHHLAGADMIGIYPLMEDQTCYFLAVDFDKGSWRKEAAHFYKTCKLHGFAPLMEVSQSGNGCHVWMFFEEAVPAAMVREAGEKLLRETARRLKCKQLDSFDRFFPAQSEFTGKGLGNLIALPLQGKRRKLGRSVFVDELFQPYSDQWSVVREAERSTTSLIKRYMQLPTEEKPVLKNGLLIPKSLMTESQFESLKELCSFHNPDYYKAKSQRRSTRMLEARLKGYEECKEACLFPRGKVDDIQRVLQLKSIKDERNYGVPLHTSFMSELFPQQELAVEALLQSNCGIVSAGPGFGKTVVAAALISRRQVNTLILVHRTQLVDQWKSKLTSFLSIEPHQIGQLGGGKQKPTGIIDVATIQSVRHQAEDLEYGQIIVDECHHISAYTFEEILKQASAAYVHGLTATPKRRDGWQPFMTMQCGPVVYETSGKEMAAMRSFHHILKPQITAYTSDKEQKWHDHYEQMTLDAKRNEQIFNDVLEALDRNRSPIVLSQRIAHINELEGRFQKFVKHVIVLHGQMRVKEKREAFEKLAAIPSDEERLILATGGFVGEGFDDPRLDTLFLVMPIKWSGSVEQYVGRLHRSYAGKESVEVYDYVDKQVPALKAAYKSRLAGYKRLGYLLEETARLNKQQMRLF
ncbi:DEAD/DEAH box helicase [Alkalicoccus luteus]|uniref:DEAD/DEAH box helicase family protein n=1 Tax=Alkalicoccus luteus TaxID=1237094 RepID=A0A969TVZ6_9BACI|nr:DEAD/DEAH box helicase [Alkalicoccus luteus]NJP38632.1 DEAD/DEAH box helicase family protein [Alkalicoccus luteus]